MTGYNMYGKIRPRDNTNIRHIESGVEAIDNLPRRPKKKRSFDFIIGNVNPKAYPWEM